MAKKEIILVKILDESGQDMSTVVNAAIAQRKERQLFQVDDGGVMPTSPLHFRIKLCEFSDISSIFEKYHYKGKHIGGGISFCISLCYKGRIIGGAVVGKTRHDKIYSNSGKIKVLEIRRMACLDEAPKNSESYFLSKIIWFIKKYTDTSLIISYADQSVGHVGTIYKASNFQLIGKTAPSKHVFWDGIRYHPRSLTIDRPYSYKLRVAIKSGEAKIITGLPKLIYGYKIKERNI